MRIVTLIISFLLCLSASLVFANVPSSVSLTLSYNKTANNFHILDQVSESLPEFFLIPEYKTELKAKFADEKILSEYRYIRKKYQDIPHAFKYDKNSGDLFAPNPEDLKDPILDAFFTSYTVSESIDKLKGLLTGHELTFLSKIFDKYNHVFENINSDSKLGMQYNLNLLNYNMDEIKIAPHLNQIREFYQSPRKRFKSVLFFWSPSMAGFSGNSYGDHLIIRTSSKKIPSEETAKMLVSVVVHEATHHISAYAPYRQKIILSKAFLSKSNIDKLPHYLFAIEEPLVMATQMLFVETNYPDIYRKNQDWFNHPMAIKILPMVTDYIHAHKTLDIEFMEKAADIFNSL